jgi:hypothetical protein
MEKIIKNFYLSSIIYELAQKCNFEPVGHASGGKEFFNMFLVHGPNFLIKRALHQLCFFISLMSTLKLEDFVDMYVYCIIEIVSTSKSTA